MNLSKFIECLSDTEVQEVRCILFNRDNGKHDIYDFVLDNKLSTVMKNALMYLRVRPHDDIRFVEDVSYSDFIKCKQVGRKSWEDFCSIRKTYVDLEKKRLFTWNKY